MEELTVGTGGVAIFTDSEYLPLGSKFNLGGPEFTVGADSYDGNGGHVWTWTTRPAGLEWYEGQPVTVSVNLAPVPESATVDGTTLVLTHAEVLDTGSTPAAGTPGPYTVKVNGSAGPTVSRVSVGARTVTLTLATAVTATDIVTVDYDAPTSSPLQDVSGLDAPDFKDFMVTNNTTTPVTIEAQYDSIGGGVEDLLFTLTREGVTTDALVAKVTITQEQTWLGDSDLEHEVTFPAGLKPPRNCRSRRSEFSLYPLHHGRPHRHGVGRRRLGRRLGHGADHLDLGAADHGQPTKRSEYTFAEVDPAEDVAIYVVATLHPDYRRPPAPARDFHLSYSARSDTTVVGVRPPLREDLGSRRSTTVVYTRVTDRLPSRSSAGDTLVRKSIGFAVVDDASLRGLRNGLVVISRKVSANYPSNIEHWCRLLNGTDVRTVQVSGAPIPGDHHGRGGPAGAVAVGGPAVDCRGG